jgi:hypothetical protein
MRAEGPSPALGNGPSAACKRRLRRQFFSVGGHATSQKAALARACSSVRSFTFLVFSPPPVFFFYLVLHFVQPRIDISSGHDLGEVLVMGQKS